MHGPINTSGAGDLRKRCFLKSDHANTVRRHFKPPCKKVKIDLRWRDLRHFAMLLWIEQGFRARQD
ncbi:MAG: hypothetical protein A3G18_08950 [Rhodospirillales bacterium RIFCSPLOWO2_12_FULL_58_28]|nr:MAG: hypothetical protein A3H92_01545 [Rhodospirillales bacterium RIFCSPLOWO2_02_FULL_58_16]OHC78432.1 MAG: hypothetical protein A3G18_08950 [Rhodospirillales bacterium RIFCSPLOWO2_12_FULL_58_28]